MKVKNILFAFVPFEVINNQIIRTKTTYLTCGYCKNKCSLDAKEIFKLYGLEVFS